MRRSPDSFDFLIFLHLLGRLIATILGALRHSLGSSAGLPGSLGRLRHPLGSLGVARGFVCPLLAPWERLEVDLGVISVRFGSYLDEFLIDLSWIWEWARPPCVFVAVFSLVWTLCAILLYTCALTVC